MCKNVENKNSFQKMKTENKNTNQTHHKLTRIIYKLKIANPMLQNRNND